MTTNIASIAVVMASPHSYHLHPPAATVPGLPGATARPQATLSLPANWPLRSFKRGVLVVREARNDLCQYTVKATTAVAAGDDASAKARVRRLAPSSGPRLLSSGASGRSAWRVTRPAAVNQTKIVAVRVDWLGKRLWQQTTVTAVSDVGDECHAGTYRDTAGPGIARALATARTSATVRRR
jgi:hypothetical protein